MQSNNMKELISRNIFVKIGYRDCIDFTEFFGEIVTLVVWKMNNLRTL